MKITGFDIMHMDGGTGPFSYLKLRTDEGLVGWAEFSRAELVGPLIRSFAPQVIGCDPCNINAIDALFASALRRVPGGIFPRVGGAVLNACLDIKGKALGLPVYELIGGAVRDRVPVYWSHCGLFRAIFPALYPNVIKREPIRTLDGLQDAVREAAAAGYSTIKANMIPLHGASRTFTSRGLAQPARLGFPGLHATDATIALFVDQLAAMREAAPGLEILFDLNFFYKAASLIRLAQAAEPYNLGWLEMDMPDPGPLAEVRRATRTPIGSLEQVPNARALRPWLDQASVDVAIIDPQWHGVVEMMKMAQVADTFDVNVSAHCSAGPLGALISAHVCAAIPNFRIMEYEAENAPWVYDLLSTPNRVENGEFVLPEGPGWGVEVVEEVIKAHRAESLEHIL